MGSGLQDYGHVELPSVGLRPAQIQKYEAPREGMEPVALRRAPRSAFLLLPWDDKGDEGVVWRTEKVSDMPPEGPTLGPTIHEGMTEEEMARK